jgi:Ca-activated chloride channel homolog
MQFKLRTIGLTLLTVAVLASFGLAQTTEDKTLSPYFFVSGDLALDHLPLKDTNVKIDVSGVIADVTVRQIYRNEGQRPINARYVFPASTRAAVYALRMKIGNQVIVAKIKEREKAQQEFEQAKQEGKSASLLEQDRPNVFSMNLANLMPNEQVEIELRYTELLMPTEGVYEVVFPTVVGPRYASSGANNPTGGTPYLKQTVAPNSTFHLDAKIAAGMPIQEVISTSHQITPQWQGTNVVTVSLAPADKTANNRDFILRYRLAGQQIASGLLLYRGETENFFLYMAQPPQRPAVAEIPGREYIFVVDVSGSMEGFPLNVSKRLLRDLIGQLRPTDMFNVVLFSGAAAAMAPQSLPANQTNLDNAINLIDKQRGGGGTELLGALQQAMNLPRQPHISRSVVLITDGYISAEQDAFDHIRNHLNQCNVFSFGIGASVNRYLIDGVAKAGMGEPFVVTQESEAPALAARFREYIQTPVLTNLKVRAEGFEVYDVEPQQLPDLFAQRPVILFGKWRGNPRGVFELQGQTGQGVFRLLTPVAGVQPDESNRALRYLWARARIAELADYGLNNPAEEDIKQITALGLQYNLLTRYTSFIAVRESVSNPGGQADDVHQPLPLPEGVGNLAVGSEPELLWLLAIVAVFGMFMFWRSQQRLV